MSERAFLLISLGPIQDFIASARRCQDLWFGSSLLSHLARKVASLLKEQADSEITMVFPGNEQLDDKVSVANKIAAVVPAERATALGREAEKLVGDVLDELAETVFNQIEHSELSEYFHRSRAEDQLASLMECPWVSVPCPAMEGDAYAAARDRAEALLAARKNTKAWGSTELWAANVPKSSLDGLRESVIDEAVYDRQTNISVETRRRVFGVQKSERLCGVGLLKRLGQELDHNSDSLPRRPHFHSTSHMAAVPLFAHFDRSSVRQKFDELLDKLVECGGGQVDKLKSLRVSGAVGLRGERHAGPYDGSLLYDGRLDDLLEQTFGIADKGQRSDQLKGCRKSLQALMTEIGHREPTPYYAMLLADGDRMGVVIDSQRSAKDHAEFSEHLDGFAQNAKKIVETDHGGSLIYSGGDDVLAMVPLHRAIDCAHALARDFASRLSAYGGADSDGKQVKPTLSCGVAIVHHLMHFAEAREVAKRAERLAKTERNALAVIFDKRSGGERSLVTRWDASWDIIERLRTWDEMLEAREVSHGFLREVEELSRTLRPGPGKREADSDVAHLLEHELTRIMARKQPGAEADDRGLQTKVRDDIKRYLAKPENDAGDYNLFSRLQRLGSELYLALELHRVRQLTQVAGVGEEVAS